MRVRHILLVILFALLVVLAFGIYSVRRGFSAHNTPTAVEAWVATRVRNAAIPSRARQLKNPVPATQENLAAGMAHWADHCASCHANDGSGETEIGRHLYPRAPDVRQSATQEMSDGELFYIIENGIRLSGMPAWGGKDHGEEDSWKLDDLKCSPGIKPS